MTYRKNDRPDCPACGDPIDETCQELAKKSRHNHSCGGSFSVRKRGDSYVAEYEGGAQ